jgi:hypothetical protein
VSFSGCINFEFKAELKVLSRTAPLTGTAAFLLLKEKKIEPIIGTS